MKLKYLIFILIEIFLRLNTYSQEIKINASNKSLNKVLIEIRDKYDVQFSFDDTELSKFQINLSKSFASIENAIEYLLKDLPLSFEKVTGVYIIYSKKSNAIPEKVKPKVYSISGRILESKTNESLPYTQLVINSSAILSDQNGNFQFSTTIDSIFNIRISQLGYSVKDTILYSGRKSIIFYLVPADQLINEITVRDNVIESFSNTGNEPATIKLNHKVTKYLPGSSDNSVFNLLRLQPGVLASGEQANDIIIWGAYAGQSRIIFDGFTVFGLKNYNDNISAINPLMTKNIQLKKAGYDASFGDCVGGLVIISGKDGDPQKPHFNLGINNYTINTSLEIPILKKSSLQLAYRQTYYNLYNDGFKLFPGLDSTRFSNLSDIYVYPDYAFRDFNIKYSLKTEKNIFYVSFLNGNDKFDYSFKEIRQYREIEKSTSEKNSQSGVSVFFERKFGSRLYSNLTVSNSRLYGGIEDTYKVYSTITSMLVNEREILTKNGISETKAVIQTNYQTRKNHNFELNLQVLNNSSEVKKDSLGISIIDSKKNSSYYTIGFKDVISLNKKSFDIGIRASYLPYLNKSYLEPRISYSQTITEKFKFNMAWGIYRQFLVKSSTVDEYGNYRYLWTVADDEEIPVLKSNHFVGGFSYTGKNIVFSFEPFYKNTFGLTRYMKFIQSGSQGIFRGDGQSFGFDFYTKYNFYKHTIWISYTFSKTLEHFDYFRTDEYLFAPQDQRHEIKLASIINLDPFYLSADYIYGSGFLDKPLLQKYNTDRISYSRLDVAATFKFPKNRNLGECGISILNVLNTPNKKFANFEKIPITQIGTINVLYEAVPFTPTIFLKLSF